MKKTICIALSLVIISMTLTGCTVELHERMLIKGIGIDLENDQYVVTVRVAKLTDDTESVMTATGDTVYDALNNLSFQSGNQQMYTHSHYIIFGDSVAQDGIDKAVDFFIRYFKANPVVNVFVSNTSAKEILNTTVNDELVPSEEIENLSESSNNAGKTISTTLLTMVSDSLDYGSTALVPIISTTGESVYLGDTAVLKNFQVETTLSSDETMAYLSLISQEKGGSLVASDDKYGNITGSIINTDCETAFGDTSSQVDVFLTVNMSIASITFSQSVLDEDFDQMEELLATVIKNNITSTIEHAYESGCDILKIGYLTYSKKTEYWKEIEDNWDEYMMDLEFNVEVKVNILRSGEENRPTTLQS